jgi:hypothetical protein
MLVGVEYSTEGRAEEEHSVRCSAPRYYILSISLLNHTYISPDVSYTDVPDWTLLGSDSHVTFARLSKLAFPEHRSRSLNTPHPSKSLNVSLPPDEQLLCYDFLYYVSTDEVKSFHPPIQPPCADFTLHAGLRIRTRLRTRMAKRHDSYPLEPASARHG